MTAGDHGTPERGGGFFETRLGKRHLAPQAPALEYRREQVGAQVPEPLIRIEPIARFRTLQADGTGQRQRRQQLGTASGDGITRGLHPLQCGTDIGPLRQQIGRNPGRHRPHDGGRRKRIGNHVLEVLTVAAQQHPQPRFGIGQAALDQRQLGLAVVQAAPGGIQFANVRHPLFITNRRQRCLFLEDPHDLPGELPLPAQVDDLQIGTHRLGEYADPRRLEIRFLRQPFGAGGPRRIAVPAPEVQFIGEFRAQRVRRQVPGGRAAPHRTSR